MKRIRFSAVVLLFCFALTFSCAAIDPVDSSKSVSLTVDTGKKNVEMTFEIYQVASVSGFGAFELTKEFTGGNGFLPAMSAQNWDELIGPLCSWIDTHKVIPTDVGKTGSNGMVTFPICRNTLKQGLYLVVGQPIEEDGVIISVNPMLICVPDRQNDDSWDYSVKVSSKEVLNCVSVTKVWKDEKHESSRPEKVSVQLMQGSKKYGLPVELDKNNNWSYTWKDLPSVGGWKVEELTKLDNYSTVIESVPGGFTITNVYKQPTGDKLPQTGLLWWPVAALALCGMTFFTVGWIKRSHRE